MTDLAARVLAAIAEEEPFAHNALGLVGIENPWWTWQALKARFPDLSRADCVHISRHGARDALRRCAADRKIVEIHQRAYPFPKSSPVESYCVVCDADPYNGFASTTVDTWCETLRLLAEGYGIEVGQ